MREAEILDAGPVCGIGVTGIMLSMTSRPTTSKVLLIAESRAVANGGMATPVRRYRIARIRPENRLAGSDLRAER